MRRHVSISTRVGRQHDARRRGEQRPVRVDLERLAAERRATARRALLPTYQATTIVATTLRRRARAYCGERRWRTCRRRRSVGQPTRGRRWRERAGVRRRRATRRGRRASSSDMIAAASAPASTSGTRMPVRSCCTMSGETAGLERDDRRLAQLRLDRDEAEPFVDRRNDERCGAAVKVGELRAAAARRASVTRSREPERAQRAPRSASRSSPSPTTSSADRGVGHARHRVQQESRCPSAC